MAENPYTRLRTLCGINQKDFAEKYGFSKSTMTYLESGQYPNLSSKMITSLGQECYAKGIVARDILRAEFGELYLQHAYSKWQSRERKAMRHLFQVPPEYRENISPMQLYVKETTKSLQKFCKTLKIPAISVTRYIRGTTRQMPKTLKDALKDIDYTYLNSLIDMQERWIDEHA